MALHMGRSWRIVEMGLWDRDAIDLVGPGFIELVVALIAAGPPPRDDSFPRRVRTAGVRVGGRAP
jgi:hypothetical protein